MKKLVGLFSVFFVVMLMTQTVFADTITVTPPQVNSDYYYNANFTAAPVGAWSGGGSSVVEEQQGVWESSVTYDGDLQALKLGYITAKLQTTENGVVTRQPVSNDGEYIIEADFIAPTGNTFENEWQFSLASTERTAYAAIVSPRGEFMLNGTSYGTMETNKWYTFRVKIELPAGRITTNIIEKDSGTIVADRMWLAYLTNIVQIRVGAKAANTTNFLYTQNWKFYKNNLNYSILPDLDIEGLELPLDETDYFINRKFELPPTGTSVGGGMAAEKRTFTWTSVGASYNGAIGGLKMANVQAEANTALDAAGTYIIEMDVIAPTGTAFEGEWQLQAYSAAGTTLNIAIVSTDGNFMLNGNNHGAVKANTWYTVCSTLDLSAGRITTRIFNKATGENVAERTWLNTNFKDIKKVRIGQKTANTTNFLYTQNWKFFKDGLGRAEAIEDITMMNEFECAVFSDSEGNPIDRIQGGEINIRPQILKVDEASRRCQFMIAVYDTNDVLCQLQPVSFTAEGSARILWSPRNDIKITVPDDSYTVKCFAWNDLTNVQSFMRSAVLQ